ncbi:MAG: HAD family phosphatase [Candidatus Kerfeldbacteria bacterium]|nr:HAD family phosphatase [Candidatus Kerfeldbacteria bacterium]
MTDTPVQAVMFDLDGVIVDSEPIYDQLLRQWLRDQALPIDDDLYKNLLGQSWLNVFRAINQHYQKTFNAEQQADAMAQTIVQYVVTTGIPLKEGAKAAINALRDRYALAVTSSSHRIVVERILRHHGLFAAFRQIITIEDVNYPKPHPEPYEKTLAALQVTPEAAVVIEDSLSGVQAAAAAGAFVYALPDPRVPTEQYQNLAKVVHSFDDVLADLL